MEQPKNDVLKVKGLHVEFQTSHGMVHAVKDVSLEVKRGRIHALVGENGAGKSTLMKCLFGIYKMDEGEIYLDGEKMTILNPDDALHKGLAMVHQELQPVPERTIAENMYLGRFPTKKVGPLQVIDHKTMNEEAKKLGATGTHFVNPHGLHEDDHYTTAYDLYLIFNACIQNDTFKEIISMSSYTMSIGDAAGNTHSLEVLPTNYYSLGKTEAPEGIKVFGGKTGTTDQAGCCVILYSEDMEAHPYISVIMGAEDKAFLYQEMNRLLEAEKALSE